MQGQARLQSKLRFSLGNLAKYYIKIESTKRAGGGGGCSAALTLGLSLTPYQNTKENKGLFTQTEI